MFMITESELKILSNFFPDASGLTTKTLEERSGYSHERAHTALRKLQKKKIIRGKKVGKAWSYSLILNNDISLLAFDFYAINRKQKFIELHKRVVRLLEEFLGKVDGRCAVIFGSYAKGEAQRGSDIDLLIVAKKQGLEKTALSLKHKYNIRLNPVRVSSIKAIKVENEAFFNELRNLGIIFSGFEYFYNQVYR